MTKPITRLLQIAPSFWPNIGGVETHLAELNRVLLRRGYFIDVLTLTDRSNSLAQETYQGVTVHRGFISHTVTQYKLRHKLAVWRTIIEQAQLFFSADIIHVHDVYWWLLPLLPFIWYKTYLTFHGWEGRYPVRWQAKLLRWCWSLFARKTIHVGKWIAEFYWDSPDAVTYGGVSLTKPKTPPTRSKLPHLVFLGRLEAVNDLELYLQFVKLLKKKLPTLTITWVGDGEYNSECEKLGQVTGFVADPTSYIAKATLVCASSYLSMLKAQSLGKVICAFHSNLLKQRYLETFPGVSYTLMDNSAAQMTNKAVELLRNPSHHQQLEQAARVWATAQTWHKVADTYEQIWESL